MAADTDGLIVLDLSNPLATTTQCVTYFKDGRQPEIGPVVIAWEQTPTLTRWQQFWRAFGGY